MNSILRTVVMLVLSLVAAFSVSAQKNPKPKPGGAEKDAGKSYRLPATPENVQWGWFDVIEKPRLTVNSGDTVSVETWYHALNQVKPTSEGHTLNGPSMATSRVCAKRTTGAARIRSQVRFG